MTRDHHAYTNAFAWPCAWPTNDKARQSAKQYIDALALAFPGRVITSPLYFVNSVKELLGASLDNPSTPTRRAARRAFDIVTDIFEATVQKAEESRTRAVA